MPRHAQYSKSCIRMAHPETSKQLTPTFLIVRLVAIKVKHPDLRRGIEPATSEW
ncbi:hypothetical protein DPMN_170334 [Dreissena polymorpha]|uniref:Uncharacterized protein n=1 Tax=Dreissena polymorpha TaxID=45954 RepID=A0A9D4IE63_DREPO|nr:hypothetical protein DPMN_170334 [Dreissena polymorpha]